MPGPKPFLLLDLDHVRPAVVGVVLEEHAEFVLFKDPQLLQLGGDQLQGARALAPRRRVAPSRGGFWPPAEGPNAHPRTTPETDTL